MTTLPSLKDIAERHAGNVSDKWEGYLRAYDQRFTPYRAEPIRILEIGVQNGGSLELWSKYFPAAEHIIGCDINPKCADIAFSDTRIALVVGDANTDRVFEQITTLCPRFDLIIDDGSHQSGDIVKSFARYFPLLTYHGIYIAEDLHCSYWQDYEGGLHHQFASIPFFKKLVDAINHDHWGNAEPRSSVVQKFCQHYGVNLDDGLLSEIHSVEFENSMCIVRKEAPRANVLGTRIVTGTKAVVENNVIELNNTRLQTPVQHGNALATMPTTPCDALETGHARADEAITELAQADANQALPLKLLDLYAQAKDALDQVIKSSDALQKKIAAIEAKISITCPDSILSNNCKTGGPDLASQRK